MLRIRYDQPENAWASQEPRPPLVAFPTPIFSENTERRETEGEQTLHIYRGVGGPLNLRGPLRVFTRSRSIVPGYHLFSGFVSPPLIFVYLPQPGLLLPGLLILPPDKREKRTCENGARGTVQR